MHDELGQMLTGLKLGVAWLRRRTAAGGDLPAEQLRDRLAGIAGLVDQTLDAVRHIARQLRPPALDDLGLETAIEWLVDDFRSRTGIGCELRCQLDGLPSPAPHDTAAFRIVQEALTNVARHAGADNVLVHVRLVGGRLLIDVVDDGRGVPPAAPRQPHSLGILGMRERARACGGELTVRRHPGGGTRVRARLPLTAADDTEPAAEGDVPAAEPAEVPVRARRSP
ncbi:MAG TPA: sensor histidine kinase, partial [Thermoanaerobaculia bacterium]|nr:sensor histidine kinase [Thermoanaerobaculia bacterium]